MSRINLSVAIVAMVVPLNQSESRTLTGSCPAHKNSANGTEVNQNGGTFDWDPKLQGVILGAFFYPYAILQIPQGRLAEKLGAKWTIAVSLLGSAVVNLVTPSSSPFGGHVDCDSSLAWGRPEWNISGQLRSTEGMVSSKGTLNGVRRQ
ncbi:Sialin [Halotydeus destructor]|nr:Sialin [Halotydeus destructor]